MKKETNNFIGPLKVAISNLERSGYLFNLACQAYFGNLSCCKKEIAEFGNHIFEAEMLIKSVMGEIFYNDIYEEVESSEEKVRKQSNFEEVFMKGIAESSKESAE